MCTLFSFIQIKFGASLDDREAVLDIDAQRLLERECARLAVHQRQQIDAERGCMGVRR